MKQWEDLSRLRVDEAIQEGVKTQHIQHHNAKSKRKRSWFKSLISFLYLAASLARHLPFLQMGDQPVVKKPKHQTKEWWIKVIN